MVYRRSPVRAATVDVRLQHGHAAIVRERATPERVAKGDVRRVMRLDDDGNAVVVEVTVSATLVAEMLLAGEVGENVSLLLQAAAWFMERADVALSHAGRRHSRVSVVPSMRALPLGYQRASRFFSMLYDAIGCDGFNMLYDTLVLELPIGGPIRRALFRAALHALAREMNAKSPPANRGA